MQCIYECSKLQQADAAVAAAAAEITKRRDTGARGRDSAAATVGDRIEEERHSRDSPTVRVKKQQQPCWSDIFLSLLLLLLLPCLLQSVLQLRSCLFWVCRIQRQLFLQLRDSQSFVLRQLLQSSVLLPQLQQAGLLLLEAMGPWAPGAVLPSVSFSFHIVPSATRPSVCPPRAVSSLLEAIGTDAAAAAGSSGSTTVAAAAAAETHVVTLSAKLPSLLETLRSPYTPKHLTVVSS